VRLVRGRVRAQIAANSAHLNDFYKPHLIHTGNDELVNPARGMFRIVSTTCLIVVAATSALAASGDGASSESGKKSKVIIQTERGPVTGTVIAPTKSASEAGHVRPPIRVIVPDQPIVPPHPSRGDSTR
jgi:hypothetical protein